MTRLLYIANVRLPTERAHGIQIMKTCEALARLGAEIQLLVPKRHTDLQDDPFEYYGARRVFAVRRLPCVDVVSFGRVGSWIESLTFALSAFLFCLPKRKDALYSRDKLPIFLLSFFGRKTFWESHMGHFGWLTRLLLSRISGLVVISEGLKAFYIGKGVSKEKLLVARDGVDLQQFDIQVTSSEARQKLHLPLHEKLVVYSGSLCDWKGVDVLARSASMFPQETRLLFVGGASSDVARLKKRYGSSRVSFLGERPYRDIPLFLKAADILVLTGSASHILSARFTSPMKLFEYMAAGRPIVASDLPSFREVLDETSAVFVSSGESDSLTSAVSRLLRDEKLSGTLSAHARKQALQHSWDGRGRALLAFIRQRI